MKTVFMYAGQGSQTEGMGKDIYDEFKEYQNIVNSTDISSKFVDLMHNGSLEILSKTENTQPCMSIFAAGVTNILKSNNILPDATFGLSLGEYGALYASEVIDYETYISLTAFRGEKMMEASKDCKCCMSAIVGLDSETVTNACKKFSSEGFITVSNYNCPGQYVICGDEATVTIAEAYLKEQGAKRCIRLNVSGPFHTKYMKPAGDALKEKFTQIKFNKPTIPIVMNVTGDFLKDTENIADLLEQQVQNSIRIEESITNLLNENYDTFIEIGPGTALTGFLKKTAKAIGKTYTAYSIENAEDLKNILSINELKR